MLDTRTNLRNENKLYKLSGEGPNGTAYQARQSDFEKENTYNPPHITLDTEEDVQEKRSQQLEDDLLLVIMYLMVNN